MPVKRFLVFLGLAIVIFMSWGTQTLLAKDLTLTIQPGQSVRIPMRFWCLDFNKPFPQQITGPTARAPDAVVKVLQTAISKGSLTSDPYQTQLAIWQAADGTFHDVAGEGRVLAQQIVNDSANVTLPALPARVSTLDMLVTLGTVKANIENFTAITDTAHNKSQPYQGTADLVIQNSGSQPVTFVLVEGAVFKPATGTAEQTLISHQDTSRPSTLPQTGRAAPVSLEFPALLVVLGISMLVAARWVSGRFKQ